METQADQIRERAYRDYIEPAILRGERRVTIVAGDVVRSMGLTGRTPAVCSALGSKAFLKRRHLRLESKVGPPSGMSTTTQFTYALPGEPDAAVDEARELRIAEDIARFRSFLGSCRPGPGEESLVDYINRSRQEWGP